MAKKLTFGTLLGIVGILTGLVYILFPNFFITNHWSLGLGTKGLLILGIIILSLSVISFFLNLLSKQYNKLIKKHGKIFLLLYILNWIITIFLVLSLGNTMGAVVQSMIP